MFNINDFNSELNARGYAKPSLFNVMVFGPRKISEGTSIERNIPMRCFSTDLPGRRATTAEFSVYGPTTKISTGSLFQEVQLSIIISEKHQEREYFEKWLDLQLGSYRNVNPSPDMYDVGFYEDYIGTVEITNYTENEKISHTTTLIEAFPVEIGNETLSWQSTQELMVMPVTFAFKYYKNKKHYNGIDKPT